MANSKQQLRAAIRILMIALAVGLCAKQSSAQFFPNDFYPLNFTSGPTVSHQHIVRSMSGDGLHAVGYEYNGSNFLATEWRAGVFKPPGSVLTIPYWDSDNAHATNRDGTIIVGRSRTLTTWHQNSLDLPWYSIKNAPQIQLDISVAANCVGGIPFGCNAAGDVACGYLNFELGPLPGQNWYKEATIWDVTNNVAQTIGRAPAILPSGVTPIDSVANETDDTGTIVCGTYYTNMYNDAFVWTAGTGMLGLGTLPGHTNSHAEDISPDGRYIVGKSSSRGVMWIDNGSGFGFPKKLGALPGVKSSEPKGVSANGQVVVGNSAGKAFAWEKNTGMLDLNFVLNKFGMSKPGWNLVDATGVSDDGRYITGMGYNSNTNNWQGWVLVLPRQWWLEYRYRDNIKKGNE